MLPEEGFPVFYRYFRDRISWYEADAVCQFHHANLVTGKLLLFPSHCLFKEIQNGELCSKYFGWQIEKWILDKLETLFASIRFNAKTLVLCREVSGDKQE